MIRVAVVGATGYAGAELVRILAGHPAVKLTMITSRQFAGTAFDNVFPAMAGMVPLVCEALDEQRLCQGADVVFTALPHKLPMALAPAIIGAGKKLIDLSADFRFAEAGLYETVYQPHSAKELLDQAVYGLSEVYADRIKTADLIGNPGCYPTCVLLPLVPLVKAGLVEPSSLIADCKSGVSGAGRSPSLAVHFCEVNESFKAYKVAAHRHNPEMDQILTREAAKPVAVTFVPHLVPMTRGMLATIYANLAPNADEARIRHCLTDCYTGRPFVRLCPPGRVPDTVHVKGTNFCDIGLAVDKPRNRLILMSAIDNLVKGAAGQAVQNMNLMCGLEETAGLKPVPYAL